MSDGSIRDEVERLHRALAALEESVEALDPDQFLAPLGGWTPRDIVAHLLGWTRYVVEGSEQLRRGEVPFYDVDPGDDYRHVNAALIRRHASRDPAALFTELGAAVSALADYLKPLDPDDWTRDFGVRHQGETVRIADTVGELIDDFEHHTHQIVDHRKA